MPNKVMFSRGVDLVPLRKGIYKDLQQDLAGFRLLVQTEEVEEDGVKKRVPVRRERKWGEDPEYDRVMRNFGLNGEDGEPVCHQIVFGWANVTVQEDGTTPFDWQGDIIDTDVLETAAYNFVLNREGGVNQEHEWGTDCGWLVESMMFTKDKMAAMGIPDGTLPEGWFVGFYIPDPDVYKKVLDGTYNMFSIEGVAARIPLDGADQIDGPYV